MDGGKKKLTTIMILPIYTYGQQVLRQEAEEITRDYPDLKQIIQDMYET